ncbi:MAG: GPR endopeptidase [Lachnospiraceae bacterium]|nr:GPR endopeptidase [Lachnospiraceae bacterium]
MRGFMIENDKIWSGVRTDLALEEQERFQEERVEIRGVEVHEWEQEQEGIRISQVIVKTEEGAAAMGKPVGRYLTLEAPRLAEKDNDFHKEVTKSLSEQILELLKLHHVEKTSILVVGLGNQNATPDALGPKVLEHLQVTRQLSLEYGKEFCEKHGYPILSGLTPGVMAQTGMETAEIIKGVIKETQPGVVIVVDALAARSVQRLGVTIQLADTGIHPGSGVGNHRNSLTEDVLGIPVLALGVPTVVEISEPEFGPMYVTPHDIDERVEMLSYTISEAIHEALFQ